MTRVTFQFVPGSYPDSGGERGNPDTERFDQETTGFWVADLGNNTKLELDTSGTIRYSTHVDHVDSDVLSEILISATERFYTFRDGEYSDYSLILILNDSQVVETYLEERDEIHNFLESTFCPNEVDYRELNDNTIKLSTQGSIGFDSITGDSISDTRT